MVMTLNILRVSPELTLNYCNMLVHLVPIFIPDLINLCATSGTHTSTIFMKRFPIITATWVSGSKVDECQQKHPFGMWLRARLVFWWHWNAPRGLSLTRQFAAVFTRLPWTQRGCQTLADPQLLSVLSKESTWGPSCCFGMPAGALMSQLWHGTGRDLLPYLEQRASVEFKPGKNILSLWTEPSLPLPKVGLLKAWLLTGGALAENLILVVFKGRRWSWGCRFKSRFCQEGHRWGYPVEESSQKNVFQ